MQLSSVRPCVKCCMHCCRVEISEQLVVSLTVSECTVEDSGEYLVRVYNEYGEATSTTQVNVLFEAPAFTVPPTDQQVRAPSSTGQSQHVT